MVSIRLDAANAIKYLDLCERRGMTKAQFARWLIDQAIENDRLERLAAELTAARDDTLYEEEYEPLSGFERQRFEGP